ATVATPAPVVVAPPPPPAIENRPKRTGGGRDIIVSIDAGHGGADPGAIGRSGLYEKHVTLAIARAVAEYLNRQDGISARLTRDSDFF
ncbi:N-acetylmuramoyl-L-alanine amidase, partial [Acinetobacter baumannii]